MATSKELQINRDKKVDEVLEKVIEILEILKGADIEREKIKKA